jgi:hypothetical protein
MDTDIDNTVNDIISQLKTSSLSNNSTQKEDVKLTKDNLEEFILTNTGKLVTKSLGLIDNIESFVSTSPEPDDVTALSELIKAATSAVESLNKIYIADSKNENQMKIKKLDIAAKEKLSLMDNQTKILLSREDIMKALINTSDVIDV